MRPLRCPLPLPTNGILVAITVRNWTFASGVTIDMNRTARATFCTSIVRGCDPDHTCRGRPGEITDPLETMVRVD